MPLSSNNDSFIHYLVLNSYNCEEIFPVCHAPVGHSVDHLTFKDWGFHDFKNCPKCIEILKRNEIIIKLNKELDNK